MDGLSVRDTSFFLPWGRTYPTAIPAMARPAKNIPMLTEAVCITVPMVTTTHIICMKRRRPSLSAMAVWASAPMASPAI